LRPGLPTPKSCFPFLDEAAAECPAPWAGQFLQRLEPECLRILPRSGGEDQSFFKPLPSLGARAARDDSGAMKRPRMDGPIHICSGKSKPRYNFVPPHTAGAGWFPMRIHACFDVFVRSHRPVTPAKVELRNYWNSLDPRKSGPLWRQRKNRIPASAGMTLCRVSGEAQSSPDPMEVHGMPRLAPSLLYPPPNGSAAGRRPWSRDDRTGGPAFGGEGPGNFLQRRYATS